MIIFKVFDKHHQIAFQEDYTRKSSTMNIWMCSFQLMFANNEYYYFEIFVYCVPEK